MGASASGQRRFSHEYIINSLARSTERRKGERERKRERQRGRGMFAQLLRRKGKWVSMCIAWKLIDFRDS